MRDRLIIPSRGSTQLSGGSCWIGLCWIMTACIPGGRALCDDEGRRWLAYLTRLHCPYCHVLELCSVSRCIKLTATRYRELLPRLLTMSILRSLPRLRAIVAPQSRPLSSSTLFKQAAEKETKISANYNRPPAPKSRATGSKLPVYPLIFLFVSGTLAFNFLAKSRAGQGSNHLVLPTRDSKSTRDELYKKSS